jgi:hypothetical protein
VLSHFKGVLVFLEAATQHATREKEEAIYCPCKLCNNNVMYLYKDHEIIREHLVQSGFVDNYFIWSKHDETQPMTESIVDEREEGNMNVPDHVYSHHDDGGADDVGQDDEDLDVEDLMHNVAPNVLLQCRNKSFDNFESLDQASRDLLYEDCKWYDKEHTVLWMEHYKTHLADQIFVLGPTYMHYIYPCECHMIVMKGYICSCTHPEGLMIEGYTTKKIIGFYVDYMRYGKPIGAPIS